MTIFQFVEGKSDRQAADAERRRIDWKYASCLPLEDAGFNSSVLCEFRARLLAGGAERRLFEALLEHLKAHGLVTPRGRQRTDSTYVLAASQVLSRLACVGEARRHALDALARVAPDWVRAWAPPAWFERYGPRFQDFRLPGGPARGCPVGLPLPDNRPGQPFRLWLRVQRASARVSAPCHWSAADAIARARSSGRLHIGQCPVGRSTRSSFVR